MPETPKQAVPPANIESLIYMLATSAMLNLGLVPNPIDQKVEFNIQLAQHSIDLLAMLQEKTKSNLSGEEARLLDQVLYDLRMKYVKAISQNDKK